MREILNTSPGDAPSPLGAVQGDEEAVPVVIEDDESVGGFERVFLYVANANELLLTVPLAATLSVLLAILWRTINVKNLQIVRGAAGSAFMNVVVRSVAGVIVLSLHASYCFIHYWMVFGDGLVSEKSKEWLTYVMMFTPSALLATLLLVSKLYADSVLIVSEAETREVRKVKEGQHRTGTFPSKDGAKKKLDFRHDKDPDELDPNAVWEFPYEARVGLSANPPPSADNYGLLLTLYGGWWKLEQAIHVFVAFLTAGAHIILAESGSGIMNLAVLIAIMTDTVIPTWNDTILGTGTDSMTHNWVGGRFLELNILGLKGEQSAYLLQATRHSNKETMHVTIREYILSNAHAAFNEVRGKMLVGAAHTLMLLDESDWLKDIIEQFTTMNLKLNQLMSKHYTRNKQAAQDLLMGMMAMHADGEHWEKCGDDHRARLQMLAVATALAKFLRGKSSSNRDLSNQGSGVPDGCQGTCALYKLLENHSLKDDFTDEIKSVCGADMQIGVIEDKTTLNERWKLVKSKVRGRCENYAALYAILHSHWYEDGTISMSGGTLLPIAEVEGERGGKDEIGERLKRGCSCGIQVDKQGASNSRIKYTTYNTRYVADLRRMNKPDGIRLPLHPKALQHVVNRKIYRAIVLQIAAYTLLAAKGIFG